jgi:hypothetical protein
VVRIDENRETRDRTRRPSTHSTHGSEAGAMLSCMPMSNRWQPPQPCGACKSARGRNATKTKRALSGFARGTNGPGSSYSPNMQITQLKLLASLAIRDRLGKTGHVTDPRELCYITPRVVCLRRAFNERRNDAAAPRRP